MKNQKLIILLCNVVFYSFLYCSSVHTMMYDGKRVVSITRSKTNVSETYKGLLDNGDSIEATFFIGGTPWDKGVMAGKVDVIYVTAHAKRKSDAIFQDKNKRTFITEDAEEIAQELKDSFNKQKSATI